MCFKKDPLSLQVTPADVPCWGEQGSVLPTFSGGTPSYNITYTGMNGNITQTSNSTIPMDVDSYNAYLTDANKCQFGPVQFSISQPGTLIASTTKSWSTNMIIIDALTLNVVTSNASCNGEQGTVLPIPSGGTPQYNVRYQGVTRNITQSSMTTLSIDVGVYDAFITDANNCEFGPLHIDISQPGNKSY